MNRLLPQKNGWICAAALLAMAAILTTPLWSVEIPAMPDYPAHLAGFSLIASGAADPILSQFYHIDWAFIPNLASELIVPVIGKFIGLNNAEKLFLSMAMMFWVAAPALVHRALYGHFGVAPLAGGLFAYNANFVWGFLNYYFAAGLSLILFAGWIESGKHRSAWRLPAFSVAVLAVYFCHLFAAALLLLLIACFELQATMQLPVKLERLLRSVVQLFVLGLPAFCSFLFLRPPGAGGNITFNFADTWLDRIDSLLQISFDKPAWLLLAILAAALIVGLWRRAIVIHPSMRLALIVLTICTLLAPEWAIGGWGVQMRLPAVLAALAFASFEVSLDSKQGFAIIAALIVIAGFNAAAMAGNWRYYDKQYREFRSAARQLPIGARVMTVLDGDAMGWAPDQPYWHMAELEIPARHVFTPLMFATPGQHVVQLQPSYRALAATSAWQGSPPDISELNDLAAGKSDDDKDIELIFPYLKFFPCHFDNAVVIHSGGRRSPIPTMLKLLHHGSFFDLYTIQRPAVCA